MLRGFFVIFLLCMIALVAVFGFRGQKGTEPPTEIFPDMVRQMKVRAQAPLDFFSDGRGPRLPVAGTAPLCVEMPERPAPGTEGGGGGAWARPDRRFFCRTDYCHPGKKGDLWGTEIS